MLSIRRFGFKQSTPKETDPLVETKLGSLPKTLPSEHSNKSQLLGIFDQGLTESCVGNAVAQQLRCSIFSRIDREIPAPSRLFIYFNARAFKGDQHWDGGTYMEDAYTACDTFGFAPEVDWTFDYKLVNHKPSWRAYQSAADQRVGIQHFFVRSKGVTRKREIMNALSQGHTVAFGAMINEDFTNHTGLGLLDTPHRGDIIGGHAMLLVGYDQQGVEVCNSWGHGWGLQGLGWLSWNYILSDLCSDFSIVTVAPDYSDLELTDKLR